MSDLIIRKAHPIVEAGYRLSIAEQRIILLSLAKLDSRNIEQSKVTLFAKDYANSFNVSEKIAYRDLLNASKRLYDRSIILKGESETTEFRWIESRTKYHKGEGRISFEFSHRVIPYLFELDKRLGYTQYHLLSVSGFNGTYSIRLYELCKKIHGMQNQEIEVDEIRRILMLDEKYKEFKVFKRDVLTPSINEINAKSDLFIDVKQIKCGRKIVALKFIIELKEKVVKAELENNKRPPFPHKNKYGKFVKLDKQNPKMSSAEYGNYAKDCLAILDNFYSDLDTVTLEDLRNYWVFLEANASFRSKLGNKQKMLEELRKRGFKLVDCELVKIDKKQIDLVDDV